MATQQIDFIDYGNDGYCAHITSTGNAVIEIERSEMGLVSVSASIAGLDEVPIAQFKNPYTPSVIFQLNIPKGVDLKIISATKVNDAHIFTED